MAVAGGDGVGVVGGIWCGSGWSGWVEMGWEWLKGYGVGVVERIRDGSGWREIGLQWLEWLGGVGLGVAGVTEGRWEWLEGWERLEGVGVVGGRWGGRD